MVPDIAMDTAKCGSGTGAGGDLLQAVGRIGGVDRVGSEEHLAGTGTFVVERLCEQF